MLRFFVFVSGAVLMSLEMVGSRFLAPPGEGYARAAAEARRAAEIDSTLAEPHATMGHVSSIYDWDWQAADREFRHAISLNPRYATARRISISPRADAYWRGGGTARACCTRSPATRSRKWFPARAATHFC